jgi:hypothetical protein
MRDKKPRVGCLGLSLYLLFDVELSWLFDLSEGTVTGALVLVVIATAQGFDTLTDDHGHKHYRRERIRPLPAKRKV